MTGESCCQARKIKALVSIPHLIEKFELHYFFEVI